MSDKYLIEKTEFIGELETQATLLRHRKSGARVLLMQNNDENKVFAIGFRTPVDSSTGVPHIIEHSVLCGSEKYPVKDPFMFLAKSSLNTFLNAMTFADKTIYPVASCNDKDLRNLMSVYMDAVLFPNIYKEEKIFRQEGWHYEMNSPSDDLTINGVVYSEMKGVFSDPEDILDTCTQNSLYPDICYGYESGGLPTSIPTLSYEEFKAFHRRYYHPSNSYIYLYGNMDMDERLEWLDTEYLSKFDRQDPDSAIPFQKPFEKSVTKTVSYPIKESEDTAGKTWLSLQYSTGSILDNRRYYALMILEYVLLTSEGAPLKQALIGSGLGEDVMGGQISEIQQPFFKITLKNTDPEKAKEFVSVVRDTLRKMADEGIKKESLTAAINNMQFRIREADFGGYPKGLFYYMQAMESWLYDDNEPVMHLRSDDEFEFFRSNIDKGYFESIIRELFLENTHCSLVIMTPEQGLDIKREKELEDTLAAIKASMSDDEIQAVIDETRALKEYQSELPAPEQLLSLPHLELSDVKKEITRYPTAEKTIDGVTFLHHEIFTNGITYLKLLFDISDFDEEDIKKLTLLREVIGLTDTARHTYAQLSDEVNMHLGGLDFAVNIFDNLKTGGYKAEFVVSAKFIHEEKCGALELVTEILRQTSFADEKRLGEVLRQLRSRTEVRCQSIAHSLAAGRALSYEDPASVLKERINGVDFLRYADAAADMPVEEVGAALEYIYKKVFAVNRLIVSVTDDAEGFADLTKDAGVFLSKYPDGAPVGAAPVFAPVKKNEGFKTTSQVNYVALAGRLKDSAFDVNGAFYVLRSILATDYLWNNIRVRGGAYGAIVNFTRTGNLVLVSYRDPNVKKTLEVYRAMPDFIGSFDEDERAMTDYIISVIGAVDAPLTPSMWGAAALDAWMSGTTDEKRQKTRDEILSCTADDIRALAPFVKNAINKNQICVVGGAGSIDGAAEEFSAVEELL
ncbi:MAG: insulinase family protein [Lachnospiraceae bacterium]|nr:insulinase family protein [Lachnospiraceae bacterium]